MRDPPLPLENVPVAGQWKLEDVPGDSGEEQAVFQDRNSRLPHAPDGSGDLLQLPVPAGPVQKQVGGVHLAQIDGADLESDTFGAPLDSHQLVQIPSRRPGRNPAPMPRRSGCPGPPSAARGGGPPWTTATDPRPTARGKAVTRILRPSEPPEAVRPNPSFCRTPAAAAARTKFLLLTFMNFPPDNKISPGRIHSRMKPPYGSPWGEYPATASFGVECPPTLCLTM